MSNESQEESQTDSQLNASESSTEESIEQTAVQQDAQESPPEQQTTDDVSAGKSPPLDSPPELKKGEGASDVNWENQYYAQQRQLEKVTNQLNVVAEKLNTDQGQKQEKYSIEELEAFAETTDNDSHLKWAKGEIRKLEKEEAAKVVKSEISAWKQEQINEATKAEVFNEVMARHPDAFKKNAQGVAVGWDDSSPMAQRIAIHMQDPELKSNPRGLRVAAALAYQELGPQVAAQATKQTTQAKAEVKDLQKKTLTEGGGVSSPPQPKTPVSQAKEKLASTGSVKDGAAAMKAILSSRGRIKESS